MRSNRDSIRFNLATCAATPKEGDGNEITLLDRGELLLALAMRRVAAVEGGPHRHDDVLAPVPAEAMRETSNCRASSRSGALEANAAD